MVKGRDLYEVLQVNNAAEPEVIEAAYRRLARKYHPDVNQAADATDRMRAINSAYEVLSNPATRAAYDRSRTGSAPGTQSAQQSPRSPGTPPPPSSPPGYERSPGWSGDRAASRQSTTQTRSAPWKPAAAQPIARRMRWRPTGLVWLLLLGTLLTFLAYGALYAALPPSNYLLYFTVFVPFVPFVASVRAGFQQARRLKEQRWGRFLIACAFAIIAAYLWPHLFLGLATLFIRVRVLATYQQVIVWDWVGFAAVVVVGYATGPFVVDRLAMLTRIFFRRIARAMGD